MSKLSSTPLVATSVQGAAALPVETTAALDAARAALAERARLEAMRPSLAAELKAAVACRDAAAQAVKAAELDFVLSGDPPNTKLVTIAANARQEHEAAGHAVTRLEHAVEGLPARLQRADEGLMAANIVLAPLLAEVRRAGVEEFQRELIAAVEPLAALAARWRARTAGLGLASSFISELRVPGITTAAPVLSGKAVLTSDGTSTALDDLWRTDPEAMAIFQAGQAVSTTAAALGRHETRIRAERQTAEIEARNARPPQRQVWNIPPAGPTPMPPGPRFVPNSWASTQHFAPAQIPADRILTGGVPASTIPTGTEAAAFQPAAGVRWQDGDGRG